MNEFNEAYRRQMEQAGPTQAQLAGVLERLEREERGAGNVSRRKRVLSTVLAAAVLTAALSIAALAASPTLRQRLEGLLGGFAPYSQEVEGVSVTDQGIRVSVVKALGDESGGTIYLEIQDLIGDRLTAETYLYMNHYEKNCVDYDAAARTLLVKEEWWFDSNGLDEQGVVTIPIQKIMGGESFGGVPLPQELLAPDNVLKTTTASQEQSHGNTDDRIILLPEQTPRKLEGIDYFTLSSMGFDERGRLHIQIKLNEGYEVPWFQFYVNLNEMGKSWEADPAFRETYPHFSLTGSAHELEDSRYVDFCIQPVTKLGYEADEFEYLPKEYYQQVHSLTLEGWIGTKEWIEGDWTLEVPIEPLPGRTVEVGQLVNGKRVESATFSVKSVSLHVTMTEGEPLGALFPLPLTVYLADGSSVTVPQGLCAHGWREDEPWYQDRWDYPDPINPAEVTAFSIGCWYIPLKDNQAQPGYWLTS